MARRKRKSVVLEKASKRLAGLEAISLTLNLGTGLTLAEYSAKVDSVSEKMNAYNQLLSQTDAARNDLRKEEKVLGELSERMREAVGAFYGHDSNEYEKAGGVRKSERKKPKQKPSTNHPS